MRLKQRKLIDNEGQIIDPNDVAIAATHGAAWIILSATAMSDATKEFAADILKKFSTLLAISMQGSATPGE